MTRHYFWPSQGHHTARPAAPEEIAQFSAQAHLAGTCADAQCGQLHWVEPPATMKPRPTTSMNTYTVSCDPYGTGARLRWTVRARTKREAIRRARRRATGEGVMHAGWRGIKCVRG